MKHTPGPWKTGDIQEGKVAPENDTIDKKGWEYKSCLILSGDTILADVKALRTYRFLHDFDQFEANAKLISAAPDLLEACQSIYNSMEQSANMSIAAKEHYKNAMDKCKSAIQKATE